MHASLFSIAHLVAPAVPRRGSRRALQLLSKCPPDRRRSPASTEDNAAAAGIRVRRRQTRRLGRPSPRAALTMALPSPPTRRDPTIPWLSVLCVAEARPSGEGSFPRAHPNFRRRGMHASLFPIAHLGVPPVPRRGSPAPAGARLQSPIPRRREGPRVPGAKPSSRRSTRPCSRPTSSSTRGQ